MYRNPFAVRRYFPERASSETYNYRTFHDVELLTLSSTTSGRSVLRDRTDSKIIARARMYLTSLVARCLAKYLKFPFYRNDVNEVNSRVLGVIEI